eukprot:CAMPEP_0170198476 /NCGR_PEP_ID=MMETSP0040_2-20121228/68792_1 /TAXON_ID=641309 /ORGANISM="Lotharella oceanica, Strain CCMP622" /LENGTH=165 /DNA_ID=CAMNT_0010448467 /DNA_START=891 /DNA_END=1385 /DNA_ORIENTATION=-
MLWPFKSTTFDRPVLRLLRSHRRCVEESLSLLLLSKLSLSPSPLLDREELPLSLLLDGSSAFASAGCFAAPLASFHDSGSDAWSPCAANPDHPCRRLSGMRMTWNRARATSSVSGTGLTALKSFPGMKFRTNGAGPGPRPGRENGSVVLGVFSRERLAPAKQDAG